MKDLLSNIGAGGAGPAAGAPAAAAGGAAAADAPAAEEKKEEEKEESDDDMVRALPVCRVLEIRTDKGVPSFRASVSSTKRFSFAPSVIAFSYCIALPPSSSLLRCIIMSPLLRMPKN